MGKPLQRDKFSTSFCTRREKWLNTHLPVLVLCTQGIIKLYTYMFLMAVHPRSISLLAYPAFVYTRSDIGLVYKGVVYSVHKIYITASGT